jgi:hypothetical protein
LPSHLRGQASQPDPEPSSLPPRPASLR